MKALFSKSLSALLLASLSCSLACHAQGTEAVEAEASGLGSESNEVGSNGVEEEPALQVLGDAASHLEVPIQDEMVRETEEESELKIVSWNIEWLSEEIGSGHNPRQEPDFVRLREYVERLDADVFVLQEVDGEAAARHIFAEESWEMHFVNQSRAQLVGVVWRRGLSVAVHPDVVSLDVGGVRAGADVTIGEDGEQLRILGVHLKSGCWGDDYRSVDSRACNKLELQLPVVEAWIDERAGESIPFMVVGDFNRRLSSDDIFFQDLNDGDPAGLELHLPTDGNQQQCWGSRYPDYIDHFVLDQRAADLMVEGSWGEMTYLNEHTRFEDQLSDHCPMFATFDLN